MATRHHHAQGEGLHQEPGHPMNNPIVIRINRSLPVLALGMVGVAALAGDAPGRVIAAVVGAGLGLFNWQLLRWLLGRFMQASERQKAGLMLLVVAKMGLLMGAVVLVMMRFQLEPVGFLLGLSVLFLGPVVGALWAQLFTDVGPGDGNPEPGAAFADSNADSKRAPAVQADGLTGRDSMAVAADEDL